MKRIFIFSVSLFLCANVFAQDWCFYISGKELGRGDLLAYKSDRDALKKCTVNCEVFVQSYVQNATDAWNITKKKAYKYKIKSSGTFWIFESRTA